MGLLYSSSTALQAPESFHFFLKARPLESKNEQDLSECSCLCVQACTVLTLPW